MTEIKRKVSNLI
uniref:Uncharacterized protein n=1 Tax=Arundo donax TaxID=35708 RepID=A0A0A8Y4D5_ARUDO